MDDRIIRRCLGVARRILDNEHDAQDATQDALLKAWRNKHLLPAVRNPEAYFVTITARTALDLRKLRARHKMANLNNTPEPAWEPREEADDLTPTLNRLLRRLTPKERAVVTLRRQGVSFQEISQRLGIPAVTARRRLCTALKKLRQLADEIVFTW